MVGAFRLCPYKFWAEFVQRRAESGISVHLHAGGALAAGIEETIRAFWDTSRPEAGDETAALRAGFRRLARYYGDYVPEDRYGNKSWGRVAAAFVAYFDDFGLAKDELRPYMLDDGRPACEFTFAIPTEVKHPETGDPIMYVGRLDRFVLTRHGEGQLAVLDEKSTTSLGAQWSEKWSLRSQFIGYMFAARSHGFPVDLAFVRGIGLQKTDIKTSTAIVHYRDWLARRWWHQLHIDLHEMTESWRRNFWSQRFDDACTTYGRCAYYDVCNSADPSVWLSSMAERSWNPLAKDPTETREQLQADLTDA